MTTAILQQLLVTLLETGQAIAAKPDDPMHEALNAASDIEWVVADGESALTLITADGRTFSLSMAESK